jgi:hypothetical protein
MPLKRTKGKQRHPRIEEADLAAFLAGEGLALHLALRLMPWEFAWPKILTEAEAGQWTVADLMQRRDQIKAELLAVADRVRPPADWKS